MTDFNAIEVAAFKKVFFQALMIQFACIIASYVAVRAGIIIPAGIALGRSITLPVLALMTIAAFILSRWESRKIKDLSKIEFDERVVRYLEIYKSRVSWFILNCFISCLLFFVTTRSLFLYFALFDVLRSFSNFPTKAVFRRDLKTNDIILV
jgi:hypothetical protein